MKTTAGLLFATLLTMIAGCAQKDWIDRTLVTVDVTGTWYGKAGGEGLAYPAPDLWFELKQEGPTVKGSVGRTIGSGARLDGTVAGDVFRFKLSRGDTEGELTVDGDEMSGMMSAPYLGSRRIILRRTSAPSQPGQPQK